jgi:hypothetical protein
LWANCGQNRIFLIEGDNVFDGYPPRFSIRFYADAISVKAFELAFVPATVIRYKRDGPAMPDGVRNL